MSETKHYTVHTPDGLTYSIDATYPKEALLKAVPDLESVELTKEDFAPYLRYTTPDGTIYLVSEVAVVSKESNEAEFDHSDRVPLIVSTHNGVVSNGVPMFVTTNYYVPLETLAQVQSLLNPYVAG
jgi:hypothetical protein